MREGFTRLSGSLAMLILLSLGAPARAADYNGIWELQAIGQDGAEIQIEHEGDALVLYRVMHPEFEGQKYTLEHLYKGRIAGGKLSGQLLVRDDPGAQFEALRPFDGQIKNDTYMVVDELPLKMIKPGKAPLPVKLPEPKRKKRASDAPPLSQNAAPEPAVPESDDAALVANVLGAPGSSLFQISARIRLPSPADDYQRLGDQRLKEKKDEEAIEAYTKALEIDPKRLELYSTLATLYGKQKKYQDAKKYVQLALRYDPHNKLLKRQLTRYSKS